MRASSGYAQHVLGEPLERFLAFWQTKRDGRRRGVVEIRP
jgi:hypothetical protein